MEAVKKLEAVEKLRKQSRFRKIPRSQASLVHLPSRPKPPHRPSFQATQALPSRVRSCSGSAVPTFWHRTSWFFRPHIGCRAAPRAPDQYRGELFTAVFPTTQRRLRGHGLDRRHLLVRRTHPVCRGLLGWGGFAPAGEEPRVGDWGAQQFIHWWRGGAVALTRGDEAHHVLGHARAPCARNAPTSFVERLRNSFDTPCAGSIRRGAPG